MEMIAQDEAAIALFEAIRCGGFGNEPVARWVIVPQFERRWLGIEPNQAAVAAFDNLEDFVGGVIEAISGGEENAFFEGAAGGTGLGIGRGRRLRLSV